MNLTKILSASKMRAEVMTTIPEDEPASLHVLIQLAPVDVVGQAVTHVVLALHLDNGQLSSVNFLLNP